MFLVYWFRLKYFVFSEECKNKNYSKEFFDFIFNWLCVHIPQEESIHWNYNSSILWLWKLRNYTPNDYFQSIVCQLIVSSTNIEKNAPYWVLMQHSSNQKTASPPSELNWVENLRWDRILETLWNLRLWILKEDNPSGTWILCILSTSRVNSERGSK